MAKHMGIADRKEIESLLEQQKSLAEIARRKNRAVSTIVNEVMTRRVPSSKNYQCNNTICRNFATCTMQGGGFRQTKLLKTTPDCFRVCRYFNERVCHRMVAPPYVCNGCEKERNCPLRKHYYIAETAQAAYEATLHTSRKGVKRDDDWVRSADEIISDGLKRGQSFRHIIAANPETFKGISQRDLYNYLERELFSARQSDLPQFRPHPKHRERLLTKTDSKCRVGRTYVEYLAYMKNNPGLKAVEIDTVEGVKGGKIIFTMMFPCGLMLGFLREAKTSQTCTRIFNMLWEIAGPEFFREMFAVILTDNGPEFSDPDMIENWRSGMPHNPTKLSPRGVRVFYCDPYCSSQKPHVERNHLEVRRILEKGTSFDQLVQEDICLVMSHVNSYARESLGGLTPYDAFVRQYGEKGRVFLEKLGIRRIPGPQVTLSPLLLGAKFKAHADKVVVDRYMKK